MEPPYFYGGFILREQQNNQGFSIFATLHKISLVIQCRPTQKMVFLNLYGLRKRRSGGPFFEAENCSHHRNSNKIEAIRNTTMDIDAAGHQHLQNTLLVLLLLTIILYQNQESVRRTRISRKWLDSGDAGQAFGLWQPPSYNCSSSYDAANVQQIVRLVASKYEA